MSGRYQNASEVVREANLAAIEAIAREGIAAIQRGDYTLVSGPEDSRALLERLNVRATLEVRA